MKNYLLTSLYEISKTTETYSDSNMLTIYLNRFNIYKKMQEISINSYKKNLRDDWELICLSGTYSSLSESFISTFNKTYKIWKSHDCNILYVDPDTLCLKPTDIFSLNFSAGCSGNCGVRYFPAKMTEKIWNKLFRQVKNWNHNKYDYEQDMYNSIYKEGRCITDLVLNIPINEFREKHMHTEKNIIHLHASRSASDSFNKMNEIYKKL